MQWIALDNNTLISVPVAIKRKRYLCPKCFCPIQLRGGPHRQTHFYHLRKNITCTLHQKSEEHFHLQLQLAKSIGGNIEHSFPEIHRIADVAWEERKIVFEIQCSSICLKEVQQRCADYRHIGWEIIWLLSERRFNKKKLSTAEAYLRQQTSYFFSSNPQKDIPFKNYKTFFFDIYDQCEILKNFYRIYKGPPLKVDPTLVKIHSLLPLPSFSLPITLQQRWNQWRLRVDNDVLSQLHSKQPFWIDPLITIEQCFNKYEKPLLSVSWKKLIKGYYLSLLRKIIGRFLSN